jgi:hypothetical protein
MPGPFTKNSSVMKKIVLALLFYFFLVIACVYSSLQPIQKPLNVSVKFEITGRGYYDFNRGEKHNDYFSKVIVTNNEPKPVTFWMMSCSWWNQTLIFDTDSIEFSGCGCDKNIPVKVELKPAKSIIFYPVFHDSSKKRIHTVYSVRSKSNNQVRIGFILLKNESKDSYPGASKFVRSGNIYWSNPVSLDYRNNGYKIINN